MSYTTEMQLPNWIHVVQQNVLRSICPVYCEWQDVLFYTEPRLHLSPLGHQGPVRSLCQHISQICLRQCMGLGLCFCRCLHMLQHTLDQHYRGNLVCQTSLELHTSNLADQMKLAHCVFAGCNDYSKSWQGCPIHPWTEKLHLKQALQESIMLQGIILNTSVCHSVHFSVIASTH